MKILNILLLAAIVVLTGCQTYLGREKIYQIPTVKENALESKVLERYWQYNVENGKIVLTNSEVRAVVYEKIEEKPYYYSEAYLEYPIDKISFVAKFVEDIKNPVGKVIVGIFPGVFPFAVDLCRWGFRWISYPIDALNNDWNLKEDGPGFWYRLAYLPVIANCNPFMLPPYLENSVYVAGHTKHESTPVEKEFSKSKYKADKEFGVIYSERRVLFINGKKVPLESMADGRITVNLRDKEYIPFMLPVKDVRVQVKDKNKTVIDLKLKTTDLMQGEHLYLWNIVQNKKANYGTRFAALNKLHSLSVMEDAYFLKLQKSMLDE